MLVVIDKYDYQPELEYPFNKKKLQALRTINEFTEYGWFREDQISNYQQIMYLYVI
jgi:hypothetical protein